MTRFVQSAVLLLLALGLFASPARGDAAAVREARKALRTQLHELAGWCKDRKLFGSRYEIYEAILALWPDDETARRWNGYERAPDGGWLPTRKKRPRNLERNALKALRERQARLADDYVGRIERAAADLPAGERRARCGSALALALRFAPQHDALRARNGEVRGKDANGKKAWILVETQRSRTRRGALRKAAKAALAALELPRPAEPEHEEEHSTVTWTHILQGARARMLATRWTSKKEALTTLQYAQGAFGLFEAALGRTPPSVPGLSFYVFPTIAKGNVYVAAQPHVTEAYLKFSSRLVALWLPQSPRVVIKSPEAALRIEAAPRQTIAALMGHAFGISAKHGWAAEGFGLRLTYHFTGTHLIYSVRPSQYGEKDEPVPDLQKRLRARGADWIAEGRALLASPNAPDLRLVLGKTVNTLTPEDILYGYVLAVFLMEGRTQETPGLLRTIASLETAEYDAAIGEHLGMDVPALAARVRRWLEETSNLR